MKRLWGSTFSVLTMAGIGPPSAALEDDSSTGRSRSGAPRGPSGELEVVAAAGEGSGWTGFGCGGRQMRVRYVVGAVEGRVSSRPVDDPDGAGWTVVGGTALEAGREEIVDEPSQDSSIEGPSFPSGTWAVPARFGHHERWIGAEAGVGMVFKWREASPTGHWLLPYPDVRVSVGPRSILHGFVGIGNSQASSMGISFPYVGVGWHPASSVRLEGRFALEVVHAASQYRGDLIGFVKVAPSWHVRLGAGAGLVLDQVVFTSPSGEASLGVLFAP